MSYENPTYYDIHPWAEAFELRFEYYWTGELLDMILDEDSYYNEYYYYAIK